ncbi:hypothetical protein C1J05_00330 [Sulfitobacter sp. JL08]|uniref:hypothetical protein n=1 Tax=Sulfitobacter sp. JL08 TaxID=2070369 RepID=UPI000E0BBABB|nr:hypothetical protein [Sulfitobacter sp. JL08]AXI53152.1 hypothetical protein C1J05_00330 [Sulfitobacter sp. JL08]
MRNNIVLILGSGPNAVQASQWGAAPQDRHFDRIVAINNAWQIRADWDFLIHPEDFPPERRPGTLQPTQQIITADTYVAAQNALGGFVYAGGTMAFTAAYWALHTLAPKVLAFLGCDMVYPASGPTHFYGTGTADPLRADVTLQHLPSKSARLALKAAQAGCHCVNLSRDPSQLLFPRARLSDLAALSDAPITLDQALISRADECETSLGYFVPSGRYWEDFDRLSAPALAKLDALWLQAYGAR